MKQGKRILLGIVFCAVLFLAIGILWLGEQPNRVDTSHLEWGIKVGDQFLYTVNVGGSNTTNYYNETSQQYNVSKRVDCLLTLTPLNNSKIKVTILQLPSIPPAADASSFAETIIVPTKCKVNFENGTELPEEFASEVVSLFSQTLLPIGDWNAIDLLYTDEAPDFAMESWYYSRQLPDAFAIGHALYGPDYGKGWEGNVSLITGVPISAVYWKWNAIDGYALELTLTLIQFKELLKPTFTFPTILLNLLLIKPAKQCHLVVR